MANGFAYENPLVRAMLLQAYRAWARSQVWRSGPRIFVNSLPKAGTHLVTGILDAIPGFALSRLHVDAWDIHQQPGKYQSLMDFEPDIAEFERLLRTVRPGQVATGHLPWRPQLLDTLMRHDFNLVVVTRDIDDVTVSNLHYIKSLRRHFMHERLVNDYSDDASRVAALRAGIPPRWHGDCLHDPMSVIAGQYEGWLEAAERNEFAELIRFETIVGARSGGSDVGRKDAIARLLRLAGHEPDGVLIDQVNLRALSSTSVTFRSGRIGEGRDIGEAP